MTFHFGLFPGKINERIFQIMLKTPFGAKYNFSRNSVLHGFLIMIKYHCAKFSEKN